MQQSRPVSRAERQSHFLSHHLRVSGTPRRICALLNGAEFVHSQLCRNDNFIVSPQYIVDRLSAKKDLQTVLGEHVLADGTDFWSLKAVQDVYYAIRREMERSLRLANS